jgi:hypothetical protein
MRVIAGVSCWRRVALVAVLALFPGFASADDAKPMYHELVDVLDASRPAAERQAALDEYRKRALAGDVSAQYFIGSLYHIGDGAPGNLLAKNTDEAARFLGAAATHGALDAMAKMAEIEIARGRTRGLDAMVWTQAYLYYIKQSDRYSEAMREGAGYPADLLYRATAIYDASKDEEMKQDLASFIATHNDAILAGMRKHIERSGASKTQAAVSKIDYRAAVSALPAHYADNLTEYVVAFDRNGSATDAWLLDSVPETQLGRDLRAVAMRMRVNTVDEPAVRYAILPLQFSTRKHALHTK